MSLQFIVGGAGSGKSHYIYEKIIREAADAPDNFYYIVVPEQFTMQTQKNVIEMTPNEGIWNIDVLSFQRLAYRVMDEVGTSDKKMIEDTGKSMILKKLALRHRSELAYLGSKIQKPGCLEEVKSLISEFLQYGIEETQMEELMKDASGNELLTMKLKDILILYRAFKEYLGESYMTAEELPDILSRLIPMSNKLKNSVFVFDGFTGFTPIQIRVIDELLKVCKKVTVTVTMTPGQNLHQRGHKGQLFFMSRDMIYALTSLTTDLEEPYFTYHNEKTRFRDSESLEFLEKNILRYRKAVYDKSQDSIRIFQASDPRSEIRDTAVRISGLVKDHGLKYGDIAVISGDLESYSPIIKQMFEKAGIPYFIDETHTILMNPFVEFVRSAIDMVNKGLEYESVFRYLRCGMSSLTAEEIDILENYVRALGIRGLKKWDEKWIRIYKNMDPEMIGEINDIREKFIDEIREFAEQFSKTGKPARYYCETLYYFILRCDIAQKLSDREKAFAEKNDAEMEKEYAGIYKIVMELLDKLAAVLGEENMNAKEFLQLLETGFSNAQIALIPQSQDQVLVGDIERTRLKDIKALFFVGVNEGNVPKKKESGGLLNEIDREFFEESGVPLAPDAKEQMSIQRFYLYLCLTKPQNFLTLSYCRSNQRGEPLNPSYLISSITAMFPDSIEKEGVDETARQMEFAENGLQLLIEKLRVEPHPEEDSLFSELYSWYLRNETYEPLIRRIVEASFLSNPHDAVSRSVAKALYGEISPHSATRLEKYAACAYAHFLQYGLKLTERAEYKFQAMDFGNIMHHALEEFSLKLAEEGLSWAELTDEKREALIDACVDSVTADYGNTILKSSERNKYMIERIRRILKKTVWAMEQQLQHGDFIPEGFEVKIGGGRIDRLDVMEEDDRVYVKIIDYKSGNTSFDLLLTYHGLQMQLVVYLDGALQVEKQKHPDKEIVPAGIFYYNIKDPMIELEHIPEGNEDQTALKELKMNGLVQADEKIARHIDRTLDSIPFKMTKSGISKQSNAATREQFETLNRYVKRKIHSMREEILNGNAETSPYSLKNKNACTYCQYKSACSFDRKIPGYEFKNLESMEKEKIWKTMKSEETI